MKRPAKARSIRGLLLVEAVLAAVIIGVGVAAITRGLGAQLHIVQSLREQDALLALARRQWILMELALWTGGWPPETRDVPFEPPADAMRWTMAAQPLAEAESAELPASLVSLTAQIPGGRRVRLSGLWPDEHVPDTWTP